MRSRTPEKERAWEAPGAPAFWLWSECLRELGEELPPLTTSVSDELRFATLTTIVALEAPRGVCDLLSRHLARLEPPHREVVAWAAVGGSPIDVAAIAAASKLPSVTVTRCGRSTSRASSD